MKERGGNPNQGNPELIPALPGLTQEPIPATFKAGDIFMSDGPGTGDGAPRSIAPNGAESTVASLGIVSKAKEIPKGRIDSARNAWSQLNQGKMLSVAERRTQDMLIARGISPIAGGSGTDPEDPDTVTTSPVAPEDLGPAPIEQGKKKKKNGHRPLSGKKSKNRAADAIEGAAGAIDRAAIELHEVSRELAGINQSLQEAFLRSGAVTQESREVPDVVTFKYTNFDDPDDPDYGKEKTDTINFRWQKATETFIDGATATRRNIASKKDYDQVARDAEGHISGMGSVGEDEYKTAREYADLFLEDIYNVIDSLSEEEMTAMGFAENLGKLRRSKDERKDKDKPDIEPAMDNMTPDQRRARVRELKEIVKKFAPSIQSHYSSDEIKERGEDMPTSLEGLARLARSREEGDFARGGAKDLLHLVTVKDQDGTVRQEERVNLANFYEWVRNQMWRVHDFNSTSEANFFSDEGMGVKTTYRTINFYEMVFTPSFFRQRFQKPENSFNEKTGRMEKRFVEDTRSNEDYKKLQDALLYEVYIFQLMRNGDFTYTENMAGVKGMTEALRGIFKTNPLTKDDYMERILTMASMSRRALGEKDSKDKGMKDKLENNFIMGDAVRTAWAAYLHISDFELVGELLGTDSPFFQREYEEYNDLGKTGKRLHGGGPSHAGEYDPNWFGPDGNINPNLSEKDKKSFMKYMNIALGPSKNQTQIKEVRARVALSLMQEMGISHNEARLAEAWAFAMCRFTGIFGRNDVEAVGFDQITKQTSLEKYRQRQASERRRAKRGSKYTMEDKKTGKRGPGLKRITLTFAEATRDEHGRALYEIIQGGQGRNIDQVNNPIKKDRDFESNYEKDAQGNIVFVNYRGAVVAQEQLVKWGLASVKGYEIDGDGKVKFKNANGEYVLPHEKGLRPVKQEVIFRDAQGNEIQALAGRAVRYVLDKDANPTFYDSDGRIVAKMVRDDTPEAKPRLEVYDQAGVVIDSQGVLPRIVDREVQRIEFGKETMKQYMANVIEMSTEWYEFIINSDEMDLRGIITGTNRSGRPIFDTEKLNKLRDHIRKNITYALSTWAGTDYTKTISTWEGRDEAPTEGDDALEATEMSMLRSMFGNEALAYIQLELQSEERNESEEADKAFRGSDLKLKDIDVWHLERYHDILTDAQKREIKICVWTGIFTYMVGKEVENHTALDTNALIWNHDDVREVGDMLEQSGILNEEEIPVMQQNTGTQPNRVFARAFSTAMVTGTLEGFWQMIQAMFKQQSLV